MKPSVVPLGGLIMERLDAAEISMGVCALRLGVSRPTLWRFLQGKTLRSNTITLVALCRALELTGADRSIFVQACERLGHIQAADEDWASTPASYAGETDSSMPPLTRLSAFLGECLRDAGMTQSSLAQAIEVAPSTISRLLRGKFKTTHTMDVQRVCDALGLSPLRRRTFLALAVEAGLFTLTLRQALVRLWFRPVEQAIEIDFDEVDEVVGTLRARRNQGDVAAVYTHARELFKLLYSQPLPTAALLESPKVAQAKLRIGFEYCEAQAAYLGWYDRVPAMIRTLDKMEVVLTYFPPEQVASEYGHLLNLRAPLYRQQPYSLATAASYHKSIEQFTSALETYMPLHDEPTLRIELLRNRAHVYLLRGNEGDRNRWYEDLRTAANIAGGIRTVEHETFQALVAYSWGEGYKRLLARPSLTELERKRYMRSARDALRDGEAVFRQHPWWGGYALLAQIADMECLAWEDPDEALERAASLRAEAQRLYPSLVQKIERTERLASRLKKQPLGYRPY